MSRPVIVLRPEPGLTATLVAAFRLGLTARGMPLAKAGPVSWKAPSEPFDGLLIGSANAIRYGGRELDKVRHLPVLAVGEATAQAARDAGLSVEQVGEGGLQGLLDALPSTPRRLLRLAGETHLPLEPPAQIAITTVVTYAVRLLPVSRAQAELLRVEALVLLHSGEMAQHFAQQCEALGIDRGRLALAAMAPRIAQLAGPGWGAVHISPERNDAALLEMTAELCNR